MKKAIEGKMYNTAQAKQIGKRGADALYVKKDGGLFIFRSTRDTETIIPLDPEGQLVIAVTLDAGRLEKLKWAAAQNRMSVQEYISKRL